MVKVYDSFGHLVGRFSSLNDALAFRSMNRRYDWIIR
jgi:hypothetical protein